MATNRQTLAIVIAVFLLGAGFLILRQSDTVSTTDENQPETIQTEGQTGAVASANEENIQHVDALEFAEEIKGGGVIIDVRTGEEFEVGHIEGAINIDYYNENFRSEVEKLDKEVTYYIYCRSGNRSDLALFLMQDLGFEKIITLTGGLTAWVEANLPVSCVKC